MGVEPAAAFAGGGALSTSIFMTHYPMKKNAGMRTFMAVIVFSCATIGFALSRHLRLSMPILMVLGCADVMSVVVRQSLVQLRTPNEMGGRISAVNVLFIRTSNQVGEFESGVTAKMVWPEACNHLRRCRQHRDRVIVDAPVSRTAQAGPARQVLRSIRDCGHACRSSRPIRPRNRDVLGIILFR